MCLKCYSADTGVKCNGCEMFKFHSCLVDACEICDKDACEKCIKYVFTFLKYYDEYCAICIKCIVLISFFKHVNVRLFKNKNTRFISFYAMYSGLELRRMGYTVPIIKFIKLVFIL